jgi:hypothetical protein
MEKQIVKTPKPVAPKKIGKPRPVTAKLSKKDPDYYAKIGAISAAKRKLNKAYFSDMAKKSHGPNSARDGYHGGRKPKTGA